MGAITSLFAWKYVWQAGEGVDRRALLRSVDIDPDGQVNPAFMIADDAYYGLLERMADEDPNPLDLSLRTGASMRCEDYGAFGLAFKSALTPRGSCARSERYGRVLTNVSTYTVEDTDEGSYLHLHRAGARRLGLRMSNEATITAVLTICREVSTGALDPLAIFFKHPAPASVATHEAFFDCPVHFDADRDAILVPSEALDQPNRVGDASISKFFDSHLEAELAELNDLQSLEHRVRIQVSQALSEGVPKVSDIARRLGMSGRTLQRRLSAQNDSFQTLVDEARRQLAERLLGQTDYSLAEIAYLTGFSEQSAFTRAFKRWAGQTPRSFRVHRLDGD